jgi:hypothetical protein
LTEDTGHKVTARNGVMINCSGARICRKLRHGSGMKVLLGIGIRSGF